MVIDFDKWMLNMDVNIKTQPRATETMTMILERFYDLIVDTRRNNE